MKKNLKKLFAIIMTVAVVLSMAMSAMAEESVQNNRESDGGITTTPIGSSAPDKGSLTITAGDTTTTYSVYKVFSAAKANEADDTYTWTLESSWSDISIDSVEDVLNLDASGLHALAIELATYAENHSVPKEGEPLKPDEPRELSLGYYLVVDNGGTDLTKSQPILVAIPQVHSNKWEYNITSQPKSSSTDFKKKIVVDKGEDGKTLEDTNTANIGDLVEYRLVANIPNYDENAKDIVFTITDTMSTGLTWENDSNEFAVYTIDDATGDTNVIDIKTAGTPVSPENYTATLPENNKQGGQFIVDFTDGFVLGNGGKSVVIVFKARLNTSAVIAGDGNPNDAKLDYSNSYYGGEEHSTIEKKVDTFTFKIDVKKVEADLGGKALPNAEFTVYTDLNCIKEYSNPKFTNPLRTGDDGTAVAEGVDVGFYYLKETKAPDGYKVFDGVIEVEVKQTTLGEGAYTYNIKKIPTAGEPQTENGETEVVVQDEKGTTLPGTGGIGTTIFTFGGLALIVLAGVLLVVYTRKQKKAKA